MEPVDYLLIGGGLTSAHAAVAIRERDPEGPVTLVGREPHLPYHRPPLTKSFLLGEQTRESLSVKPAAFYEQRRVGLILGAAVTRIRPAEKRAVLADGRTLRFRKALIATGGEPARLQVEGGHLPGVHLLHSVDNAAALAADARAFKRAVVVGAGFTGMEVAASLTRLGVEVTVIEIAPQVWPRFADRSLADYIRDYCAARGVRFRLNERVCRIAGRERVESVVTASGAEIPCDFLCASIGIRPSVSLAEEAGLKVGDGICVDEFLQTSHPDVWAGGDVANYHDPVLGRRRRVEHWGHARYCGALAGRNMTGDRAPYDLLACFWTDVFDLHLAAGGERAEDDEALTRGRPEDRSFQILFLRENRLTAYLAVNADRKALPVLQDFIRTGRDLREIRSRLADPSTPVQDLA
jgi:NADPH-dependent 2,4-dienoyl-CoA reductase/sulfur reductase-like enzyme